jgi:ABC-type dipeptide/oligopeptide/nickel transport system ATPase component/ABC-type dipeptide/oligopeptide/nickel transport system permease subunit
MSTGTLAAVALTSNKRGKNLSLTGRLLRNPLGSTAVAILAIIVLAAIFAPLLTPYDPNLVTLADAFAKPSAAHWLGADSAGRDVLARILTGAHLTLLGALVALIVAVVIGLVSGLIAGFYGGWFDTLSDLTTSLVMALPSMMVLLAARVVVGPNLWVTMAIFGALISPSIYRLVRSGVREVREELYVDAARVSGLSDARIIARHILFVVRAPIIIQASIIGGIAIAIQSGLEFLGLGDQTVPTWGVMLSEGFRNIYISPLLLLWPGLAIALTIGALVLFGNALRDALEDKPTVPKWRGSATRVKTSASEANPDAVLSVRGLTVGYPQDDGLKTVIEDIAFDVRRGEIVGLVGESGSGKTQTAWSILGLLPRGAVTENGVIVYDGTDLLGDGGKAQQAALGNRIAYVPQEPMSNLDPLFTIGHQLTAPMRKHLRISKEEARRRAIELLDRVGIKDPERTMRAYPHEVSGGMAQRVLIAGAVSCDPQLIVADEPTTALDVTVQAEILDLLRSLRDERGLAMVFVTHNFGVVADLCDSVVVMQNGHVVEHGAVEKVLRDPEHDYTKSLLASTLDGTAPRRENDAKFAEEAAR